MALRIHFEVIESQNNLKEVITHFKKNLYFPRYSRVPTLQVMYTTYTALSLWNVPTVPGVTPTNSHGHISELDQMLIEYTYFMVRIALIIRYLKLLNRFPLSGLVINLLSSHSRVTTPQSPLSCL